MKNKNVCREPKIKVGERREVALGKNAQWRKIYKSTSTLSVAQAFAKCPFKSVRHFEAVASTAVYSSSLPCALNVCGDVLMKM